MILGDRELRLQTDAEYIRVVPLSTHAIQPNSIDVHLGRYIKYSSSVYTSSDVFDPMQDAGAVEYVVHDLGDTPFVLRPLTFVLGATLEYICVPRYLSCRIEGRSSIGRWGLTVQNAGLVDSLWNGRLTLEMINLERFSLLLTMGMDIGQLVFSHVDYVEHGYGSELLRSRYQGDMDAQEPKPYMG